MTACPPPECQAELMLTAFDHTQSLDQSATRLLTILLFRNGWLARRLLSHAGNAALNKSACGMVRQACPELRRRACPEPRRRARPERIRRAHRKRNQPLAARPGPVEGLGLGFLKSPRSAIPLHGVKHGCNTANAATATRSLLRGWRPPRGIFRLGQQPAPESGASQTWA